MKKPSTRTPRNFFFQVVVNVVIAAGLLPTAHAIDLADYPLFSTVQVPGNLALALSVEWPTATSMAYISSYSSSSEYIGYFNPDKCYSYSYNSSTPTNSYFYPVSSASSHTCSGRWSGNYLNWASMQTLDAFRWILTGGYRSVDTNALSTSATYHTVLTKTYSANSSTSAAPDKSITASSTIASATPLAWSSLSSRTRALGSTMWFTQTGNLSPTTVSSASATDYQEGLSDAATVYRLYINVAVCVSATLKEDNCVLYGSTYKPEGLMQKYATQLRYAAFGYLNHSGTTTQQRDGGVMRARMNYIGPIQPVPGSNSITNTAPEWDSTTGIMTTNPFPSDATATNTEFGLAIANSGSMNYLNKFGFTSNSYKSKDPVSEMYNAILRYYKGLGNVASYTTGTTAAYADGFPVITNWTSADPIVYSCQKNFILGIGDVHTHRDGNLYGSTLRSSLEPTLPSEISADTSVDVVTATNMVGTLEGKSGLGSLYQRTGDANCANTGGQCNTYYIAGLAYDAHTVDMRATLTGSSLNSANNMSGSQTVNTYWVDVMENQTYAHKNQYWLAAKYGGFTVPNGFSPYSTSNGTGTLTDSMWYTNSDTSSGLTSDTSFTSLSYSTDASTDKRPDNYYWGNSPATIKTGLTSAFAKISSELSSANSTAYAMASPNVISGDAAYAATYDPSNWTSNLTAASVVYDSSGAATATAKWDARDLLEALSSPSTSRYVVSFCDSATTPAGITFTSTALSACPTTGRLYYPSFASISGASSVSSTPEADYVAYIRGSRTNELSDTVTSTSRIYRKRSYLLGDIVNSKVTAVSAPSMQYQDIYNPGYSAFKKTYQLRKTIVYAGANDGMLHAFDGTLPGYVQTTTSGTTSTVTSACSFCGQELFAYIPSFVYGTSTTAATSGLASYGSPNRSHYYMVDATPLAFDVDLSNVCASGTSATNTTCTKASSTPDWRTLLIGGLGKGGKGYYAIDVTNPGTLTTTTTTSGSTVTVTKSATTGDWTSESAMASKILWEFPKSTDTTTIARMGYSYGAPTVVKTKKYGWVVIFTSGYNNSDGKGYVFFVNPATGALLETVATTTGSASSPLNLAHVDAYVPNKADFVADALYGGDLQGNVWRLDLTPTAATYSAPTKMASLYNATGTLQPITTRPLIEVHPTTSKRYVLMGTGRLLADSDTSSTSVQSIYSLYDGTSGFGAFQEASTYSTPLTRSTLEANTNMLNGIGSAPTVATGWYFDLGLDSSSPYYAQRVNVDPVAYSGVAAFGVNLPNGTVCTPSGVGYVLGFDLSTGKSVLQDSDGSYIAQSTAMSGVITDIALQNVNGKVRLIAGDSSGSTATVPTTLSTSSGLKRMNWRSVLAQ